MLLREVQGEVLSLQQEEEKFSAWSSSSSQKNKQQQHQPPTSTLILTSTSPAGSGSASSPAPLLRARAKTSSSSDEHQRVDGRNVSSAGAKDVRRRESALEGPEPAREGYEKRAVDSEARDGGGPRAFLSPSLLSLGWEIANDGDGGEFYYNGDTGESRWDPPTPEALDASARLGEGGEGRNLPERGEHGGGGDGGGEAAGVSESAHGSEALRQQDGLPLPVGWEAVPVDHGRGVYYHHVASGVTQWEVPQEGDGEGPMGDTGVAGAPTDGTGGWEEFNTEEGVPFWYNAATGDSRWELPGDRAN